MINKIKQWLENNCSIPVIVNEDGTRVVELNINNFLEYVTDIDVGELKGCKYCKNGFSCDIGKENTRVFINGDEKILHIECEDCERPDVIDINYCPMCGRKL